MFMSSTTLSVAKIALGGSYRLVNIAEHKESKDDLRRVSSKSQYAALTPTWNPYLEGIC